MVSSRASVSFAPIVAKHLLVVETGKRAMAARPR
jgi:hypothetical protein